MLIFTISLLIVNLISAATEPVKGDNVTAACPPTKSGTCPTTLSNPSKFICTDETQCKGRRLCCPSNGNLFCSDPAGSKPSWKCPKDLSTVKSPAPCYSDLNCEKTQTCCFDESKCSSVCADDLAPKDLDVPDSHILKMTKDEKNCPKVLQNNNTNCTDSTECPGNQVCCPNERSEKSCSPPVELISGTCPIPSNLPAGAPCAADADCNKPITGNKCCRLDDSYYRCATPLAPANPVTTTNPITNSPNTPPTTPANPPTASPDNPITNPQTSPPVNPPKTTSPIVTQTPPPDVCPRKFSDCPRSSTSCTNPDCQPDQICCTNSRGVDECVLPIGAKPGKCPRSSRVLMIGNECYYDTNCRGRQKCCGGRSCLYYSCTDPE